MSHLAVLTSGGDAPGMNASLRAIVRSATNNSMKVYGVSNGFEGLIDDLFSELKPRQVGNIIQRGGSILQTSRSKRFLDKNYRDKARANLSKRNIDSVIVIGGEGSLKGAKCLGEYGNINVLGLPATIDRDIPLVGPTIGFDTAINTALQAIDRIRDTASTSNTVHIIELMGRNCGWISLFAGIGGGAEAVILPEFPMDIKKLAQQIKEQRSSGKQGCILIVSEGACNSLGGEGLIEDLNKVSNFDLRITKLGHIQRGGNPSAVDRVLASRLGAGAVEGFLADSNRCVVAQPKSNVEMIPFDELSGTLNSELEDYYKLIFKLA
tara:strand:+ start:408 stop:1376 length:969 start_codon:yes stop_codon:yes gene_type:complete